ncbi:hypothetical protein DYD83_10885 [Dickeya fangzhongdai]|uniref:Uncharacterized protein n=1 Tax=Dickeya fangzhongdai TaxID=1778540 RepID=A0A2K8QLP7_9GAMM|nr:hypothetical protein CVE23_10835 [Dickeya fangzhongdai]AYH48098.1 hypothetical protein B6N31_10595 [Dickeya fangzhongdai]QOH47860.1 hypothetical protein DYD82_10885 [Dickeya fangzhongdai]QOH52165.1 hypothetical protein DYD83_10885 [Dickeya fangzhongdai]
MPPDGTPNDDSVAIPEHPSHLSCHENLLSVNKIRLRATVAQVEDLLQVSAPPPTLRQDK